MKRYQTVLTQGEIRYPGDVHAIRTYLPEFDHLSDFQVQAVYEEYSDTYAAGWLMVDQESLQNFRSWALEDVTDSHEEER